MRERRKRRESERVRKNRKEVLGKEGNGKKELRE